MEEAMAALAKKQETEAKPVRLKDFYDGMNAIGNVPVSVATWELTGDDRMVKAIVSSYEEMPGRP